MADLTLTQEEFDELQTNALTVDAIGKPSFISRHHWHGVTGRLARRKLITWADHPEMNARLFAAIQPTMLGRVALRRAVAAGMVASEHEPDVDADGWDEETAS